MTKIAMFGDGNGYRTLAHAQAIAGPEFEFMKFDYGAPTREGSGVADGATGTEWVDTTVGERIDLYFDKYGVPDITWIGFNASALSLITATFGTWVPDVAQTELQLILGAAVLAEARGSVPLLSTGPGVPIVAFPTSGEEDKVGPATMLEAAVSIVSQGVRDSGFHYVEWGLDRGNRYLWDQDGVHPSADPELCYPGLVQVDRPVYGSQIIAEKCMIKFWELIN